MEILLDFVSMFLFGAICFMTGKLYANINNPYREIARESLEHWQKSLQMTQKMVDQMNTPIINPEN